MKVRILILLALSVALLTAAAVFLRRPSAVTNVEVLMPPEVVAGGETHTVTPDQDIVFDPRDATVNGMSLSTTLAELKESFGDGHVAEITNASESDSPERIIEVSFGADRTITIYPDRGTAEVLDPSFVTTEGLRVGMAWSAFAKAYSCDPQSWEGGEIGRSICADGVLVGTNEQPQEDSPVESILITLAP